jgi:chromosome segregation ATPase
MADGLEEISRDPGGAPLSAAGTLALGCLDEEPSSQAQEGARPSIEWALALEMVRYAGATCRARTAAARELVSHVRRWAQKHVREAEDAKRLLEAAEARAAAAEARVEQAEARARRAESRLEAGEAQRLAAQGRTEEISQRVRRIHDSTQRASHVAGPPLDRRARRAFTARR